MKIRTIIVIFILYLISYLSITFHLNILYPYYLLKDYLLYPVNALATSKDITLSKPFQESVISSLQDEIEELKKISNISLVLSDFNYINATIIERNRDYWFNTISVNKGSLDGIKEDMAVIDGNGLIGRVSNVRNHTSDIKLITTNDTTNKISVVIKNGDKDIYGILRGYDIKNNLLKVYINEKIDFKKDVKVETTGMGGVFPKGILVGYTMDTLLDNDEVTTIVRVSPCAKLEGEYYVSILQRKDYS